MSQPVSPQRWAWAGAIALAVALGIGRFVYTPILPAMTKALSLDSATAGWIASANFAGYLAGALGTAFLARWSRPATMVGLFLGALTTLAMGAVSTPAAFVVLRALGGIASALVLVCGSNIVLEQLQRLGRPGLSALLFAGVGMGIAVSAVLVAVLDREGVDWRGLWYASGAVSLAASIAVAVALPGVDGLPPPTAKARPTRVLRANPAPIVVAYGLFGFGYVITATFLVVQVRASAPEVEPLVWLIVGLTAAPSVAVWTWAAARIGLLRAYALASLIEAVGVAAGVLLPGVAGAIVAAALLGATFMGLVALGLNAVRVMSANPQRMVAVITVSFSVGQIVGPTFAGQVAAQTGNFVLPTLVAAGALVLGAALTGFARPPAAS